MADLVKWLRSIRITKPLVLVLLLVALAVAVEMMVDYATAAKADDENSAFINGMVLTALTGVITALIGSIALMVKSLIEDRVANGD